MSTPQAFRRLLATGLLMLCVSAGLYLTLRATFGSRPVFAHVRWAPGTEDTARQALEQRFRLVDGELLNGQTWGYVLTDVTKANIQALVLHPAVEDTHQLHRTAFRPGYFAPRLPYRTNVPWIPAALEVVALGVALLGILALGIAAVESVTPATSGGSYAAVRGALLHPAASARTALSSILRWTEDRIPVASAEAAALFRVCFGVGTMLIVLARPLDPTWVNDPANVLSGAHDWLIGLFAGSASLVNGILPWVAVTGTAFVAGLATRTSFALLAAGVYAWAIVYTTQTTYHTVSALLVTLFCLLWSRWGDAWSIDALLRRKARPQPSRRYGYSVWIPGFVLGLIYLAAAFAKLRDSGVDWILNGTVRYHFLSDSRQAMVDWGLSVGRSQAASILLSFGAIAIESLVIFGALSHRYRYRFLAGAASLLLVSGFTLLQGLFWPGWWILLLSFLPWHLSGSPSAHSSAHQAVRPLATVVLLLVTTQLVVSLTRMEVSPFLSTYDMYATTYESPAEYEQKSADSYWLVATDRTGVRHECRISRRVADVMAGLATASDPERVGTDAVTRCFGEPSPDRTLTVENSRARVDWERWELLEPVRVRISADQD